jgi:hypothetical protein
MTSFNSFRVTWGPPEVAIPTPMRYWTEYINSVLFRLSRPNIGDLYLEDDHPEVLRAQRRWTSKFHQRMDKNGGVIDTQGLSWAKCFTYHKAMRKKLLRAFGVKAPTVGYLRDALVMQAELQILIQRQSNPDYQGFNWVQGLPPREADVLGMHLFSYLAIRNPANPETYNRHQRPLQPYPALSNLSSCVWVPICSSPLPERVSGTISPVK